MYLPFYTELVFRFWTFSLRRPMSRRGHGYGLNLYCRQLWYPLRITKHRYEIFGVCVLLNRK
jgi:hypothetical protein